LTLPNYITLFRILLVPFFFTVLVSYETGQETTRWLAFALFLVAAASDALDGFLARLLKQQSQLGRILDPLADKLLILSGYLGLLCVHALPLRPPLWVTVTIVFRDMVLFVGLIIIYLIGGRLAIQPNLLGKVTTGFQIMTLVALLLQMPVASILWTVTAVLTIVSCLVYVTRELKLLGNAAS
jgi:CDP-diacylglycerol--glycerol-3-phosphate 3-phosphatidyltransferase